MKWRGVGLITCVVVLGGFLAWRYADPGHAAQAADPPAPPEVPVTVASAKVQDVPVYLYGLGTVQAFNVVQIKAQVNGILVALPAKEGTEVKKGDIVALIDPRPYQAALDQAMAQRQEDAATLSSAQLDLKRYQTLATRNFAPIQQVDDQQATVNKTTAAIAADDANIETAKINLGYCTIRAPIDGRISLYEVDVGNLIQSASQSGIISITQDKPIAVVYTLPEDELSKVQDARAHGPVAVDVFTSDGKTKLSSGTLLTPNNQIDTTTGTISLKASFDNVDDHLWPGEFVNARTQISVLPHAVTVPTLAIEHGPSGLFVYKADPNNTVQTVPVQAGYEDDGMTVVTKGLSGNETVVVSGQSRVSPGTHVKAQDAQQAAAAGQAPG